MIVLFLTSLGWLFFFFFSTQDQHFGVLQAGTHGELHFGFPVMQSGVPALAEPGRS